MDFSSLYKQSLPSSRTGPLYNAFSYPTKISPEAIALFIATHTKPGATVLDVFAGSGTTGLAALLCDKPTEEMRATAKALGLMPKWGPRKAVLYELSTLGALVSQVLCNPPDPHRFKRTAEALMSCAEQQAGWLYAATSPDGSAGMVRHTIWSDILICPFCQDESPYWDAAVKREPLRLEKTFVCPSCVKTASTDGCTRATETVYDETLGVFVERRKRVLVRIFGKSGRTKWQRGPLPEDTFLQNRISSLPLPSTAPNIEIEWGELRRTGYHLGITHLHHFYTRRNFLALTTLWDLIETFEPDLQDALRVLVLSYNATHSTLMTRVVVKDGLSDFVLTGAQSGVLYVSGLPVEKNVFEGVRRKISSLAKAFQTVSGSSSQVNVLNASSTKLDLPDRSIDYVFTDPPFGDYIPYAELNQLNEGWLGRATNRQEEIIVSPSQHKAMADYGRLMSTVFAEIARVLKDTGSATVVFHSAQSVVWQALIRAYEHAGFEVRAANILDKLQASFKQIVSPDSVKGDPILLLAKTQGRQVRERLSTSGDVFSEIIERASHVENGLEREPQRLYSRYISRCLELGIDVPLGAKEFYGRAEVALGIVL